MCIIKRILKIALITLCSASVVLPGCIFGSSSTGMPVDQVATVQRGNLAIAVTASGNLALSNKTDLAFGMAGYVEQVSVKEGDAIKQGQVLANLNTSDDWEAQITSLERQLTSARRQVTAAERSVTTSQRRVTTAERELADAKTQAMSLVAARQRALLQAELDARNAEIALDKAKGTYRSPEIDILLADIEIAEADANYAMDSMLSGQGSQAVWQREVRSQVAKLDSFRAKLNALLPILPPDDEDSMELKVNQLEIAQSKLKDAQDAVPRAEEDGQRSVEDAQLAVGDSQAAVEDAQAALKDARTGVQDAQKALDKAKAASPLVKAPFDGFVTVVSVKGGDEVYKGTVAVQVADPTKFEASVLVSEKDFFQVKAGGDATVQLDAVPTLSYPAKVTYIAPTATVQQGVANYKVGVELQSLQPVSQNQTALFQRPQSATQPGQTQRPQSTTQAGQAQRPQSTTQAGQSQRPQLIQGRQVSPAQTVQLSEGMSVTVSIVINQRNNVLLVPNQAINIQGRQTVVKVIKDGVTEQRTVRTGISDWQYTEVTDGLTEGEQIVYPRAAVSTGGSVPTTTTPAQRQGQQQQQPFMPGPGGIGR